jgi:hypothetical protein
MGSRQDCEAPSCYEHWHVSESEYDYAHAAMPKAWTRAGPSELTYCPVELLDGTFLVPKARGGLHV